MRRRCKNDRPGWRILGSRERSARGDARSDDPRSHADVLRIMESVEEAARWIEPLTWEMGRAVVGNEELVERLLIALLSDGHILVEGVPGQGKRLIIKTLASVIQASCSCIEITPDMQPEGILGEEIPDECEPRMRAKLGPIFGHLVLVEELDRASGRVQSAFLEAMRERRVGIAEKFWNLPQPFLVMATQSSTGDGEGHPLSRAQVDRFMFKIRLSGPSWSEERQIIALAEANEHLPPPNPVACVEDILAARQAVRSIYVDETIKDYIMDLVWATRHPRSYGLDLEASIRHGGSLRATLSLETASKALALLSGRWYVTEHDVNAVAMDVLRHRVVTTSEARARGLESERVVEKIMDAVQHP